MLGEDAFLLDGDEDLGSAEPEFQPVKGKHREKKPAAAQTAPQPVPASVSTSAGGARSGRSGRSGRGSGGRGGQQHGKEAATAAAARPARQGVVATTAIAVGVPPRPPPPGKWACPACTFENAPLHLRCEICSHARPAAPETRQTIITVLPPNTAVERPAEFHLCLYHLPGSTMPNEVAEYFSKSIGSFFVRRIVLKYFREAPSSHGSKGRHFVNSPTVGPSSEHDVICQVLVEFAPQEGLLGKLRQYTALKTHNVVPRVPGWTRSFAVAFFPGDVTGKPDRGMGGLAICSNVKRPCQNAQCALAHEPEGWGTPPPKPEGRGRSASKVESLSISTPDRELEVIQEVLSRSMADYKPAPPPVKFCNGCGEETLRANLHSLAGSRALYCDACGMRGVPKVPCEVCMRSTYLSAMVPGKACCLECAHGLTALQEDFRLAMLPAHLRVTPMTEGALPSKREIKSLLETALGAKVESVAVYGTSATVRLSVWDEDHKRRSREAAAKEAVKGCVVSLVGEPTRLDAVSRLRALAALVAGTDDGLLAEEFKVLHDWYSAKHVTAI